jgi:hypothetical protein
MPTRLFTPSISSDENVKAEKDLLHVVSVVNHCSHPRPAASPDEDETITSRRRRNNDEDHHTLDHESSRNLCNDALDEPKGSLLQQHIEASWAPYYSTADHLLQKRFDELLEFNMKVGNSDVSEIFSRDQSLGHWCVSLKKAYKMGLISHNNIELLRKLGFEWEAESSIAKKRKISLM